MQPPQVLATLAQLVRPTRVIQFNKLFPITPKELEQ
jgi:hypothetical protein